MLTIIETISPKTLRGFKAVLLPFLLGPITLSMMYLYLVFTDSTAINQRGLFEFYSATAGDFLILPLTWLLMSKSYSHKELDVKKPTWVFILIICVSILMSGGITYLSMQGERRDWTLPTQGIINFPGVYHSTFMAFMFAILFCYIFDYWKVMLNSKNKSETLITLTTIYWYILDLLTLFLTLLWVDDLYNKTARTFISITPQQIGWSIYLLISMFLTLRTGSIPYKNKYVWIFKQIVVCAVIVLLGNLLSRNPLLW